MLPGGKGLMFDDPRARQRRLVWVDRDGRVEPLALG